MNKIIFQIKKNGFYVYKNFLKQIEVKHYLNLLNKISRRKIKYKGVPKRDSGDKIIYNLQNKNFDFIKLLSKNKLVKIAKYFLNDPHYRFLPNNKPNYILNYFNARSSGSKLDLHIDTHIPFKGEKTFMMQFVFLLEKSSKKNGCTIAVKGSHYSGKFSNRKAKKITLLEGEPGDLIIWDSRLWHGTLANISNQSRWAIITTLSSWFIKQKMNMPKSLPLEIFKKCNNEQKQLLGYCSVPPNDELERINTKTGYKELKLLRK